MYSTLNKDRPIRQGDIFRCLPKVDVLMGDANFPLFFEQQEVGQKAIDWPSFAESEKPLIILGSVKSVLGIVISQDCDASKSVNIAFAEIKPIKEFGTFKDIKEPISAHKVCDLVGDHTRKNQKWYFLSDSVELGFDRKMGVDFESIFIVNREMLVTHLEELRLGRLDDEVAWPHFRERISEFFRRYPYNEWYPLNVDEVQVYEERQKSKDCNFILDPRYRWQNNS